jgi:hypothetical protein
MINAISWTALVIALVVVLGIFIVIRSIRMPKDFYKNQEKRNDLKKLLKERDEDEEKKAKEKKEKKEDQEKKD